MPLNYKLPTNGNMPNVSVPNKKEEVQKKDISFEAQTPKYAIEEVVLNENILSEIQNILSFNKYKNLLMDTWGMSKVYPERKGLLVNLYGESGTGKTMTAHAIAHELGKQIVVVNYAEIESKYVGETSKNLVLLFREAEEQDAVLLFDEADALLSKRVTSMMTSNDVSVNQTKSVLLNILNDYKGVAIFTTNFISNFDFAFMRRIPFQIRFDLPDERQRMEIWKHYLLCGLPYQGNIEFIANNYKNISGSDIANCVWLAALDTVAKGKQYVSQDCLIYMLEKIIRAKKDYAMKSSDAVKVTVNEVDEKYALEQLKKGENL